MVQEVLVKEVPIAERSTSDTEKLIQLFTGLQEMLKPLDNRSAVRNGFVYLAGPYRGAAAVHDWTAYADIDANINEARRWAAQMATSNIPYFCPHLNSAHMEVIVPKVSPEFWLNMDIEILDHAAALLLLPNWRGSKGARAEMEYAQKVGIPIYTHNMFERFVEDWHGGKIHTEVNNDAIHTTEGEEEA